MAQMPPSFTLVDLVPIGVIVLIYALPLMTLLLLFRTNLPIPVKVLWALIILGLPVAGAGLFALSRLIMAGAVQSGLVSPAENREPRAT